MMPLHTSESLPREFARFYAKPLFRCVSPGVLAVNCVELVRGYDGSLRTIGLFGLQYTITVCGSNPSLEQQLKYDDPAATTPNSDALLHAFDLPPVSRRISRAGLGYSRLYHNHHQGIDDARIIVPPPAYFTIDDKTEALIKSMMDTKECMQDFASIDQTKPQTLFRFCCTLLDEPSTTLAYLPFLDHDRYLVRMRMRVFKPIPRQQTGEIRATQGTVANVEYCEELSVRLLSQIRIPHQVSSYSFRMLKEKPVQGLSNVVRQQSCAKKVLSSC